MRIPTPGQQRAGSTRTLLTGADGSLVRRTVLPGGLRVVSESVPGAHSVAIGFWVGVGSRDESAKAAGASHFLEHLLFKGTDRRSPFEIAAAIESVGGDLNAFTTKECTCFHARVLADDLAIPVGVLADMITSSKLDLVDVDIERPVVLEEIAMNADDPADVAHENFSSRIYAGSALAKPVIGSNDSLKSMTRSTLWRHYRNHYRPCDVVITAAGAVDHAQLVREVRKATGPWAASSTQEPTAFRAYRTRVRRPRSTSGVEVIARPTEQAHLVIGMPGVARGDDRRWALAVLDVALGGGMSSRLFQEVREKRGLVYSIATFRSSYSDSGSFGLYAGTSPDRADETIDVARSVVAEAAKHGVTDDEVARAKGQLRGSIVMDAEDPSSRMGRLGEAELLSGELLSIDDVMAEIDSVTTEAVAGVAREILTAEQTMTVVGPFDVDRIFGGG